MVHSLLTLIPPVQSSIAQQEFEQEVTEETEEVVTLARSDDAEEPDRYRSRF
jgi:hypothetical protein